MDARVKPAHDKSKKNSGTGREREGGGVQVKPAAFAYAKARSLDHAVELLEREDARILAGGQSLIATLNMRLDSPSLLVDINEIPGLDGIARKDGRIEIGALVRHAQAERSDVIAQGAPLIAKALPHIGHPAIRNRGTLGGSIAFADPAAELPACLLALGGELDIAGPDGRRTVKADDFFKGLFETALQPRDVLTAIRIPAATPSTRVGFAEFCRRHGDYAMVGLAACAHADGAVLRDLRLAFFGVGSTPVRARKAEGALAGGKIDDARLDAAVTALRHDLDPPDDIQASGKVKRHLAGVLLRRVAKQLTSRPA
jgi:aerobic carbon-monoxide dehydrogenase medium subunit